MDAKQIKKYTFTLDNKCYQKLNEHLFPGDYDEHGAVIVAGISEDEDEIRFLGREIIPAVDGTDYLPGRYGYRRLSAEFVAKVSGYCADNKLCYFAVHCHSGSDFVEFSSIDIDSQKKGYPALIDITDSAVGALVFAKNAVAGKIWTRTGVYTLSYMTIIGPRVFKLFSSKEETSSFQFPQIYDRHLRLFGDIGQMLLKNLKVGIIGTGGGGSLINEWISRLGVGHIIAVDDQKIEPSNLPRIVGATRLDAMVPFSTSKITFLKKLGLFLSRKKVNIARRVAKVAQKGIDYRAISGNLLDEEIALKLKNCDFLFLATDNHQTRLVFNALVQQYLIPGAQIGIKVNPLDNKIDSILVNTRLVLPYPEGGCFECHQLINPSKLQEESLTPTERRNQRYIDLEEVPEPSVITLNVLSAAQAVNDLMMIFTGLYTNHVRLYHIQQEATTRERFEILSTKNVNCPDCSLHPKSRRAKGDRAKLPCKQQAKI